ncbi:MAG: amidase family protein, partial [Chthoniobacterales bacterium]|nr:amidase family protein [Chthoniobacterales bacterium]
MNSHPLNLPPPFSIEELPNLLNKLSSHSNFNAYITLKSPEILETDLSTQRRKSSLSGYTFAVKDNIDVAGFPTTAACPPFLYHPKSSNPVVQALLNAGAICIGKTNLDQFATGLVGTRSPYGIVPNPHNPSLIAGGSSSGSAVAVALDHVHFALATDTAGSGRVPAALNGIISLKPTRGLLSTRGVVPACRSLDCISFFTKSLPLARKLLHFCAFHDPADPWSRPAPPLLPPPPPPWNIGFANPNSLTWENDISSKNAYIQAIQLWQSLGHRLLEINPNPFFEAGNLLYQGPWVAERYASLAPSIRKFQKKSPQYLDPTVSSIILNAENISAHQTFSALHKLQSIQLQTRHIWSKIHFLLFPTIPTSYSIDEIRNDPIQLNFKLGSFTHFLNLLDLCAVTIPFGTT